MKSVFVLKGSDNTSYGLLFLEEHVSKEMVQNKVDEIKSRFKNKVYIVERDILPHLPWKHRVVKLSTIIV